jgi:molybdopterin-containing oxidoreductase family membrane subunit
MNYHDVTESVLKPLESKPAKLWMLAMLISMTALGIGLFCIGYALWYGIGSWGLNKTVGWAFDITDFVFWVGIGHAGTLISAILLLFRQTWRNSINRAAEAMTIFAVICAALFPLIHMGRPWLGAFWVFPLPNTRGSLWVNFNSPLLWDVFAISTYFSVSLVFWYLGLVPDFASVRDRATHKIAKLAYGSLSLGWNGSAKTWYRFELVSLILAGLSTPLVLSVHTIVSFDFATSVIPGWHTTIFPPYFVAGAIFSGFGMVQTLLVVTRKVYKLENMITLGHMEAMAKIVILTGSLVGIAYGTEFFISWYSGNHFESFAFVNRAFGPYWWSYWIMFSCNVISPQLFWFKKIRTSMLATFILSIFVNIGMWFERFVIIMTSLHRDYLPSSWAMYTPTWIEIGTFVGTFGIFFTFFFAFAKFFPVVNMFEVKTLIHTPHQKENEH